MPATKRAASKTPGPAGERRLTPKPGQVLVRMYGQGVGDCFLLAFPPAKPRARPVYVVIDCGVVDGTPEAPERMRRVVANLAAATGGTVDLLVVTHEHMDHVSGFTQAAAEWAGITVNHLWLAWTEKGETDTLPDVLKKVLERQRNAVQEAAARALRLGLGGRLHALVGLTSFLSLGAAEGETPEEASRVEAAFAAARQKAPADGITFCDQGDVLAVPGTDAVAYVLGPPRDDKFLRRTDPSTKTPQTYTSPEHATDPGFAFRRMVESRSELNAFALPLLEKSLRAAAADPHAPPEAAAAAAEQWDLYERTFPFDRSLRVALPVAEQSAAEAPTDFPALASYYEETSHWRRVDFDWLGVAESFALRVDHLVNNTSLVLAFELPPASPGADRRVLLFTGDAQVGSLQSWDLIKDWHPKDGAAPAQRTPDMADLLRRVAFYKVGHHGSHNATLRAGGVERMPRQGLTAFVPVSQAVAREIKSWDEMPLVTLIDALLERSGGRVVLPTGTATSSATSSAASQPHPAAAPVALSFPADVTTSTETLPAISYEGKEIQPPIPLWVQAAIPF